MIYHLRSVILYRKSEMFDPLSEVISLLRPKAPYSKLLEASGAFRVRRENVGDVFYFNLLSGRVCFDVDGKQPVDLNTGDFALVPAAFSFTISSLDPIPDRDIKTQPVPGDDGIVRIGAGGGPVEVQALIGHCSFGSPDADLLVSLLPGLIVVRGEPRLAALTALVRDEARAARPAREVVVEHLLQVLLIEALRSTTQSGATTGLLCGLGDERIAPSLRSMHANPEVAWTVLELARQSGLSRSTFFTRFNRIVGMPPMGYLLNWRMTLAKHMLRSGIYDITKISSDVGYGSASAFSTAFARHVGHPPARYAKAMATGWRQGES